MSVVSALQRVVGRCKTARTQRDTTPHILRYVSLRKWSDVSRVKAIMRILIITIRAFGC